MLERARTIARDPRTQFLAMTVFLLAATWAIDGFLDPYREQPGLWIPPEGLGQNTTKPLPDVFVDLTAGTPAPHPISFTAPVETATFEGFHLTFGVAALNATELVVHNVSGKFRSGSVDSPTFTAVRAVLRPSQEGASLVARASTLNLTTDGALRVEPPRLLLNATPGGNGTWLTHPNLVFRNAAMTLYDDSGTAFNTVRGIITLDAGRTRVEGALLLTPVNTILAFNHQKGHIEADSAASLGTHASLSVTATLRGRTFPVNETARFDFVNVEGVLDLATGDLSFRGGIEQWLEPGRARIPALLVGELRPRLDAGFTSEGEWEARASENGTVDLVVKVREVSGTGSAVAPQISLVEPSGTLVSLTWHATGQEAAAGARPRASLDGVPPHGVAYARLRLEVPPGPLVLSVQAMNAPRTTVEATVVPPG
ncbi:MAG TPA: hypothetical protein VNZ52_09780 [Candidatus Thermoplasmatota archaeon]|nr:hypothetical protein [Candidatus Thermoplasmatota archaeon]